MWQLIVEAPFAEDIELAVIDDEGVHSLIFPCQRIPAGWINAKTREILDVHPTHWRMWPTSNACAADARRGAKSS
ncbi:hypothetical protein PY650_26935 [Rhizobium calliandrae]|uniref:DUF2442 domain-containing protein n=1 Tax=Rhizobium calliandrae TaxID=1312182 RepID=A0ABT7KMI6_9HYPH|nr:hypothetical protein [Rhizobium calliandrae]MDL2409205.1 hypothetical protein [Rhizobium calliandrae]